MEITDNTLKTGPMGVYGWNKGDAWMDNFIVGETEADITFSMELAGKLVERDWRIPCCVLGLPLLA